MLMRSRRCKCWQAYKFLYRMAYFNRVYLNFPQCNSAGIFKWCSYRCLLYCYKTSMQHEEPLFCCRQIKICNFTKSFLKGLCHCFHLHAQAQPTAVPSVNKRIEIGGKSHLLYILVALQCNVSSSDHLECPWVLKGHWQFPFHSHKTGKLVCR